MFTLESQRAKKIGCIMRQNAAFFSRLIVDNVFAKKGARVVN